MVTEICGWCGETEHASANCAQRMAYEKRDRWAELALAIESAAREVDAAGQDGDALRRAFVAADEERRAKEVPTETVTTTDVLRFVRERIREAGGSPEQADGIRVAVNPTDPTAVDVTIPMSPMAVYSAVILAKTPEATERVANVLRDEGYDLSGAPLNVGGREAVEATLARVRQSRELDVSPEAVAAGKCCHKETPGCYCAVGFPYEEMCPACRDQPNRYVFTRCDCG